MDVQGLREFTRQQMDVDDRDLPDRILNVYLQKAEAGASLGPLHLDFPNGMTLLIIGVVMTAILVLRPQGLTGGREISLWLPRRKKGE